MCGDVVLRARNRSGFTRSQQRRVAWLLAGYRDATPTNICSVSQLAEDAHRDLKRVGCCSLCAAITTPPPSRDAVLLRRQWR